MENLKLQLKSQDPDQVYDALIDIGKGGYMQFEKDVVNFLTSDDVELRAAAIRVLGFYWQLDKYASVAEEMFLNDSDDWVRAVALMAWSAYYRNSNDKQVLQKLYNTLQNESESTSVRSEAYRAMWAVSSIQPPDWPRTDIDNIEEEVEWDLVQKLVREA